MALEINGERIEDELINEEFARIKQTYQNFYQSSQTPPPADTPPNPKVSPLPDDATLLTLVKENITRKTLLRQEALKANITIPPEELKAAIEDFIKNSSSKTTPLNFQALSPKEQNQLKEHIELNLKISAILEKISNDINPIEAHHIKAFYETNLDHYQKKERIHLHYLALPYNPPNNSKASTPTLLAESKLNSFTTLRTALNTLSPADKLKAFNHNSQNPAPQNIQELFKKHCPECKLLTGDLELREIHVLDPLIAQAVRSLPSNEISKPITLEQTLYLFYVRDQKPAGVPPLSEIHDEVKADLIREIKERKQDLYVAKLMNASKIIDYEYL